MEKILVSLLGQGGPLGALVAAVIVLVLCLFAIRKFAPHWLGSASTVIAGTKLDAISNKVATIDKRLGQVERDLENRPTREEFHKLELMVTRLQEQLKAVHDTTTQTNHAVVRMEEYLRSAGNGKDKS